VNFFLKKFVSTFLNAKASKAETAKRKCGADLSKNFKRRFKENGKYGINNRTGFGENRSL
jgi:hypothetical protein